MGRLTKGVGNAQFTYTGKSFRKEEVRNVLLCRPNHRLGNQLLMTPIVQEISNVFPNCKIDLFVRGGVATVVFENYKEVDRIIKLPKKPFEHLIDYVQVWASLKRKKYDLVINVDKNSSSGRLSTRFVTSKAKFYGSDDETVYSNLPDYVHMAKRPVYNFRDTLSKLGVTVDQSEIPSLNLRLTPEENESGGKLLKDLVQNDKRTICLYTFATDDKCYSEAWWLEFYEKIKKQHPDCNVIEVLPVENISHIQFKAPTYYSKDVREMAGFINNADLFITADCGIMHLASATETPVVGLFSVTNLEKYQPYNQNSCGIDTNGKTVDDILGLINRRYFM